MKKPKPLAGNNPGLQKGPTKNQARAPQKPHYEDAGRWAVALGNSTAKSVGHAAHDVKHGVGRAARKVGKVVDSINPFD